MSDMSLGVLVLKYDRYLLRDTFEVTILIHFKIWPCCKNFGCLIGQNWALLFRIVKIKENNRSFTFKNRLVYLILVVNEDNLHFGQRKIGSSNLPR